MNGPSCCGESTRECSKKDNEQVNRLTKTSGIRQRFFHFTRYMFTGTVIILLPKCPFCLAAYITMATGIGLSFTIASFLRILLIVLCIASISSFAARQIYIFYNKEQLLLLSNEQHFKINLYALKFLVLSGLYYFIIGA